MFCKKCGKEQTAGQKFCPVCGEPYLDENGKPYLKGFKKDIQDAKGKMSEKIDKLTQNGKHIGEQVKEKTKEYVNEGQKYSNNFSSQLDETIEKVKKIDVSLQKEKVSKWYAEIIQNPKKARIIGICLVVVIGLIYMLWPTQRGEGIGTEQSRSSSFLSIFSSSKEVKIELEADIVREHSDGWSYDIIKSMTGNYGSDWNQSKFFSDRIVVPKGKMWVFKRYDINYNDYGNPPEGYFSPEIYYYPDPQRNNRKVYKLYHNEKSVPIFREGDNLQIVILRTHPKDKLNMKAEVVFVERDNEY